MTSENLEEKTQEQKEVETTIKLVLRRVGIDMGDINFEKCFNPLRKKGYYESKNYGEVQKYGKPYGS